MTVGTTIAGRYKVLSELGRGGMGAVYLALDEKFQERVALKLSTGAGLSREEFVKRFEREARIGHLLGRTECLVRAVDWGEAGDATSLYLAMDLVQGARSLDLVGGSLAERLERLRAGARLVAKVHAKGIIHRDLKPANFLQASDGKIWLADFGLAKVIDEKEAGGAFLGAPALTQASTAMGTPPFMPPEQFDDAATVDARADVYALGVMLYTALTGGAVPFEGMNPVSIVQQQLRVQNGAMPLPRPGRVREGVPPALDELCARALDLDRAKRLASVAVLLEGLDAFLEPKPEPEPAAPPRKPPSKDRLKAAPRPEAPPPTPPRKPGGPGAAPANKSAPPPARSGGVPTAAVVALLLCMAVAIAFAFRSSSADYDEKVKKLNDAFVEAYQAEDLEREHRAVEDLVLAVRPDDVQGLAGLYTHQGTIHVQEHDLAKAEESYLAALAARPASRVPLWATVGIPLVRGDLDTAEKRLHAMESEEPTLEVTEALEWARALHNLAGRLPGCKKRIDAISGHAKGSVFRILAKEIERKLPLYDPPAARVFHAGVLPLGFDAKKGFVRGAGFLSAVAGKSQAGYMVEVPTPFLEAKPGAYELDFIVRMPSAATEGNLAEVSVEDALFPRKRGNHKQLVAGDLTPGDWTLWVLHFNIPADDAKHALSVHVAWSGVLDFDVERIRIRPL